MNEVRVFPGCLTLIVVVSAVIWPTEAIANPSAATGLPKQSNHILGGNGGLHHVAFATEDWDRTLEFYQKGLGFKVKMIWRAAGAQAAYLDSGDGSCIEVIAKLDAAGGKTVPTKEKKKPVPGALVHFCLRATRFDAAYANAIAHGATVISEPRCLSLQTITGQGDVPVRHCYLGGLSGELIELLENAP